MLLRTKWVCKDCLTDDDVHNVLPNDIRICCRCGETKECYDVARYKVEIADLNNL